MTRLVYLMKEDMMNKEELKMMDEEMHNFKNRKVSKPVDLSDFQDGK